MKTVFEEVTGWMYSQQYKHELGDSYVEASLKAMTRFQFLEAISEAIEVRLAAKDTP